MSKLTKTMIYTLFAIFCMGLTIKPSSAITPDTIEGKIVKKAVALLKSKEFARGLLQQERMKQALIAAGNECNNVQKAGKLIRDLDLFFQSGGKQGDAEVRTLVRSLKSANMQSVAGNVAKTTLLVYILALAADAGNEMGTQVASTYLENGKQLSLSSFALATITGLTNFAGGTANAATSGSVDSLSIKKQIISGLCTPENGVDFDPYLIAGHMISDQRIACLVNAAAANVNQYTLTSRPKITEAWDRYKDYALESGLVSLNCRSMFGQQAGYLCFNLKRQFNITQ